VSAKSGVNKHQPRNSFEDVQPSLFHSIIMPASEIMANFRKDGAHVQSHLQVQASDIPSLARLQTVHGVPREVIYDLVLANRILAHYSVLDTFGHISVRHKSTNTNEDCYIQAAYRAPASVELKDIAIFRISDSESADEHDQRKGPLEKHLHAAIFRARPDIQAILHCHAPSLVTFSILPQTSPARLRPVVHVGASTGASVPIYEIREHNGDGTDLLIKTPGLGDDLAKKFEADVRMVLMRGHGATIASVQGVKDLVHKGIYAVLNATIYKDAILLSGAMGGEVPVRTLSKEEVEACGDHVTAVQRSWPAWIEELGEETGLN